MRSCKNPVGGESQPGISTGITGKAGVAGLSNERELPLILLGVADPVLADKNGDGLGAADCLFQRRDPPEARAKRAAVEEGAEPLRAQPAVQLRRGGFRRCGRS